MSVQSKWKEALFASGLPLEFEAAKTLVGKGFAVDSRYSHSIAEEGRDVATFVDIRALADTPFSNPEKITARLELLTACVQRRSSKIWVFLPDPNPPGRTFFTSGGLIRVIDHFSGYVFRGDVTEGFEKKLPACYKAMEMDETTGEVSEFVVREGLRRLQYAMPRVLTENVLYFLMGSIGESVPFLICPVLLTNLPLYVLRENVTEADIQDAGGIGDVAARKPFVAVYNDYGPSFEALCRKETGRLRVLEGDERTMSIDQRRARHFRMDLFLPYTVIESLNAAGRYYLQRFFTQFIVCSKAHFADLIDDVKKTVVSAMRARKRIE